MKPIFNLKDYALNLAHKEQLPIHNPAIKTGSEILREVSQHKIEQALLSNRTNISFMESNIKVHIEVIESIQNLDKRKLRSLAKQYDVCIKDENLTDEEWSSIEMEIEDKIDRWESLLDKAEEFNISWDEDNYDPIGLEQEIEHAEEDTYTEYQQLKSDYYSSVL